MSEPAFSLEDVRQQLQKMGYQNVPDEMITKFIQRMRQEKKATQPESIQTQPQTYPAPSISSSSNYQPATLSSPITRPLPYQNVPTTHSTYSSLAQPIIQSSPTTSYVPNLPLSMQMNPTLQAQQQAYQPIPTFVPSSYQPNPYILTQMPSSTTKPKSSVTIADEEEADHEAYLARKQLELDALDERMKRHAAVAHGVKSIMRPSASESAIRVPTASPSRTFQPSNKENQDVAASPAPRSTEGRTFGTSHSMNIPPPSVTKTFPTKPLKPELAQQVERELRQRDLAGGLGKSASQRIIVTATSCPSTANFAQPSVRTVLRPSSASQTRSSRPQSARASIQQHRYQDENGEENVMEVENIETQRSLRKTYANSVQKFNAHFNPRYGPGGYRKSDPVTRYHAFKSKWDQSHFLTKKTSQSPKTTS